MGTAVRPAKTSPGPWDAFGDVDGVRRRSAGAETTAMARMAPGRSAGAQAAAGRSDAQGGDGDLCVLFCGMQWRAIGQLCDISFSTLYGLFARWTGSALATVARSAAPHLAARLR